MRARRAAVFAVQALLWLAIGSGATPALAQRALPLPRPADERPPLPGFSPPTAPPTLPPPALPAGRGGLSRDDARIVLRAVTITGSTVLDEADIARLAGPWLGREVGAQELLALTDAVTEEYVRRGFVTSGATLPDQDVVDGHVVLRVVEGTLARIEVDGLRWLRPYYVRQRLALGAGRPLSTSALERELQRLLQDPRLGTLHGELVPGEAPGEAVLRVRAEEAFPVHLLLESANDEPRSVGGWRAQATLWSDDVSGLGDTLRLSYGHAEGLDGVSVDYDLPWNARDGTVGAYLKLDDARVVTSPIDQLDVTSVTQTLGVRVAQPLLRHPQASAELSLAGELRETRSYLFGHRFSFVEGVPNGRARIALLRIGQEASWRDRRQVFALRSQVSLGLDALDASDVGGHTVTGDEVPDARFIAWLVQAQAAHRFDRTGIELLGRADVQLASEPLLPPEQVAFGGASSVRGYRENELVRDSGLLLSTEVRVPVWSRADGTPRLQIVPFVDLARGWNSGRATPAPRWIGGAGAALRLQIVRGVLAEVAWAGRLSQVERPDDRGLQDAGVHLRLAVQPF